MGVHEQLSSITGVDSEAFFFDTQVWLPPLVRLSFSSVPGIPTNSSPTASEQQAADASLALIYTLEAR